MDYKEFEAMTAALYQTLGEGSGIRIAGYGQTCRVQGKSGSWYQIDVLTEQSNGLQRELYGMIDKAPRSLLCFWHSVCKRSNANG